MASMKNTGRKNPASPSSRRPHRYRPGTVALTLREIRHFPMTVNFLIPHAPFIRSVKMINAEFSQVVNRWTPEALMALHEAAEDFLEDFLECVVVENEPRENTGVSDTDSMTKDADEASAGVPKDLADDDKPLSTWCGGIHSSTSVEDSLKDMEGVKDMEREQTRADAANAH